MTSRDDRRYRAPRFLLVASELSWRALVVAGAIALVGFLVVRLRVVVIPLGLALLVAGLLAPAVSALKRRGVPALLATWIVFLAAAIVLTATVWFVSARVAAEVSQIGQALSQGWRDLLASIRDTPLGRFIPEDPLSQFASTAFDGGGASRLLSGAATAFEVFAMAILTIVFTFFFLKDGERLFAALVRQFRPAQREDASKAGVTVWDTSSKYFRGIALIATANALMKGVALLLIGVPLVLVLMLITFIGSFIPFVGAVIASAAGALVALGSGGLVDAALVVGAGILIQQIEGNVLEPVIMSRVMRIHPLVVIASVAAGAAVAGLPGAFFAVPLVAVTTALYTRFRSSDGSDRTRDGSE